MWPIEAESPGTDRCQRRMLSETAGASMASAGARPMPIDRHSAISWGDALATTEPVDEGATGITYALDPRHAVEFNKAAPRFWRCHHWLFRIHVLAPLQEHQADDGSRADQRCAEHRRHALHGLTGNRQERFLSLGRKVLSGTNNDRSTSTSGWVHQAQLSASTLDVTGATVGQRRVLVTIIHLNTADAAWAGVLRRPPTH